MMEYVRFVAVFAVMLILFLSSPEGMLARLGLEHSPLIAALAAVIVAGVVHNYKLVFAIATVLLAVGANLSPEVTANLGFDRDYAIAALLAALIGPWVMGQLGD
ncbi:MAG TPA: hypothetical protein VFY81_07690 [Gammaproteobacteria bacterium]|nr:hypothetical protein [Gammaproteobacteria bacterium]